MPTYRKLNNIVTSIGMDTKNNWLNMSVPVPDKCLIIESDTGMQKIGDGSSLYANLEYVPTGFTSSDAAHAAMPSNTSIDISVTDVDDDGNFTFVAPDDGYVYVSINNGNWTQSSFPVSKGNTAGIHIGDPTSLSSIRVSFVYCNGAVTNA